MSIPGLVLAAVVVVTVALIGFVVLRPRVSSRPSGQAITFLALFLLPALATAYGLSVHLDHAKTTDFCLSCHTMEPYGRSLMIDDQDHLPAAHWQNRRIEREHLCYACHTTYTMFGDFQAKMRGLQHVWVYYFGTIPDELGLYEPYANRECLNCHRGARSYEESEAHADMLAELEAQETSCLDCHDTTHDASQVDELPRWEGPMP